MDHFTKLTIVSVLLVSMSRVMFAEARNGALAAEYQNVGVGNLVFSVSIHVSNVYATMVMLLQKVASLPSSSPPS